MSVEERDFDTGATTDMADVRIDPRDHPKILAKTHPGRNFFVTIAVAAVVAALLTYAIKTLPGRDPAAEVGIPASILNGGEVEDADRPAAGPVPSLMMDAVKSYMDGSKK